MPTGEVTRQKASIASADDSEVRVSESIAVALLDCLLACRLSSILLSSKRLSMVSFTWFAVNPNESC